MDEIFGGAVLAQLAVDPAADVQSGREGELVGSDDPGADGGEIIQTLAPVPLLVTALQHSRRDII